LWGRGDLCCFGDKAGRFVFDSRFTVKAYAISARYEQTANKQGNKTKTPDHCLPLVVLVVLVGLRRVPTKQEFPQTLPSRL
jgi:hypothetical protein